MKTNNEKCPECGKYKHLSWKRPFTNVASLCHGHPIRVSDLEEMSLSELTEEDYIMITDVSEKKSKKIKIATLQSFIFSTLRKNLLKQI